MDECLRYFHEVSLVNACTPPVQPFLASAAFTKFSFLAFSGLICILSIFLARGQTSEISLGLSYSKSFTVQDLFQHPQSEYI